MGSRKFDLLAHHLNRYLLVELKDDPANVGARHREARRYRGIE